ncbi:HisA/HisF-related TIM barrel protein, partial [Aeromonas caviae]|uniref:HisA/HisF-related TIM barrel protein n=1 Tax=Aeromonas caviae TaxID=648 RepID=UPI001F2992AE
ISGMGVEKVAVSAAAIENPELLTQIAGAVGKQSVVAVLDIRKKKGLFSKGFEVCTHNATRVVKQDPLKLAKTLQDAGAGEIVINFVDQDGMMQGYDIDYASEFKRILSVPVTFLGGAGSLEHITQLISRFGAVGAAAGSLFVFKGKYRAVLINYPTPQQKLVLCRDAMDLNG